MSAFGSWCFSKEAALGRYLHNGAKKKELIKRFTFIKCTLWYSRGLLLFRLNQNTRSKEHLSIRVSQPVMVFNFKLPRSSCPLKALLPMYLWACWPLNSPHCVKYEWSSCVPLAQQSWQPPDHQVASYFSVCDSTGQENHLAKGDQCWVTVWGRWLDVNWSGDSS